jgi:lipopolysaccharide transport system ATP-binding protein
MSEAPAISVRDVSKAYRVWSAPAQRLLSPAYARLGDLLPGALGTGLKRQAQSGYRDFFALRDISFEVKRGEAVGIIGRNGSGKSTLLQIIAGTLQPTQGTARVTGRVAALLELGAGFNTDFTGRENVFLSGAVLGLTQKEMQARFDEVAAFADIGEFIEQPVKTYSSGMMMRLAFAVNTCVDPDILIVDEALSVGDAPFQAKCFRRLRQLIDQGVSLLFVSHDLGTVRSVCSRALWLKNGRAEKWGEAKTVAKDYEKFCWAEQGVTLGEPAPAAAASRPDGPTATVAGDPADAATASEMFARVAVPDAGVERYGTQKITIRKIVLLDAAGNPQRDFDFDAPVSLYCQVQATAAFGGHVRLGVRVKSVKQDVLLTVSDLDRNLRVDLQPGQVFVLSYRFPLSLAAGHYTLQVALFEVQPISELLPGAYDFSNAVIFDSLDPVCPFSVRAHSPVPAVGPVHFNRTLQQFDSNS